MSMRADIVIVGAGVMGLWAAVKARQAGFDTLLLDRSGPGAGASGGVIGALAPHAPDRWNAKKQFQFEALVELPGAIADIEAIARQRAGYGRIGRIQPLKDDAAIARAETHARDARSRWGDAARIEVLPPDAFPGWASGDVAGWSLDTLTGRVDPSALCTALAAAFEALGGRIGAPVGVRAVFPGGLETDRGPVGAPHVVVAAGVSSFDLLAPHLGEVAGRGEKGQAALLDCAPPPNVPLIYGQGAYVIPHASGRIAVGATSERDYGDPGSTDGALDAVIATARALCPPIADAPVLRRWAGVRPRGNGRDPMIGAVPGVDGLHAFTAGFKISFGIAEKAARHLIAEIAGETAPLPETFRVAHHLGKGDGGGR
ncbi:MAG: NAD(P)/FAD-dependent oxidoreductase [Rubricella sp.]